jgi:DNA-binding beta-propeller fold protein YncE
MSTIVGSGSFTYEALEKWEKLPDGVRLVECPGVAVDSKDQVHVLTRNIDHPVMVFSSDGQWLRSFGQGEFSDRTHGILIGPDDYVYCVDDGTHTITKFTPDGKLVMTLGTREQPSPFFSGKPFNRPTHAAVSPVTGNIYVSDGYGNSRIHKYSPDGRLLTSWGEPGVDAGQFIFPHNVAVDTEDRVYVADRECHRVQIFDADGGFITMWNNIHRPDGMTIGPDGNFYIAELLTEIPGLEVVPGLGHRVSILSPEGQLLGRLGEPKEGEEPGRFIAPHGIAVDSCGDIYVGEVCFTIRGQHMNPPRELKSLKKLRKTG